MGAGVPVPTPASAAPERPARQEAEDGVNIAGFVNAELGTGEGARLTVAAVKAAGIPYAVIAYGETASRQQHPFHDFGASGVTYGVNLVHINADRFTWFAETEGKQLLDGRYTVGIWAWEVESFPAAMAAAEHYTDEIWAVSQFAASAIARKVSRPVFVFPHPVVPPNPPPMTRAELGLPDRFVFLFCFDFFSVMERKNPRGLIEAFARAFAVDEGPVLVIKTINGAQSVGDLAMLRAAAADRPDVSIVDGYLSHEATHALMAACDTYVSLHRGEGFGLTLAEAMALGKPVIGTAYSGNLDFMNATNSYLVPFDLVPIPRGCGQYPAGTRWAAPDLDEAARLMRFVYEHPHEARGVGQRARQDMLQLHGPEARAAFVRSRLGAIRDAGLTGGAEREPAPCRSRAMSAAAALAATAPPLGSRSAPVRLVQRAVLRLLRPLLNHHLAVVEKLIDAMADAERRRERAESAIDRRQEDAIAAVERRAQDLERRLAALSHEVAERIPSARVGGE